MRFKHDMVLKVAVAITAVLVAGAAFAAYLRPGMVLEFANIVLCY